MKLSKLIKQLEKIQSKKGDVEVMVVVDGFDCELESVSFDKEDSRVRVFLGQTEGIDY